MLLSKLAYLSVRRAVGDMGRTMSYSDFCEGKAEDDTYLSSSVGRVFSDINAFFGRLVQMEKIPAVIEGFDLSGKEGSPNPLNYSIELSELSFKPNIIKAVMQFREDGSWVNLQWSVFQKSIRIRKLAYDDRMVYVQYRLSLPSFSYEDIVPLETDEQGMVVDKNIDLYERYGIMEEAMPLCIDYVDAMQNRDSDIAASNNLMIQTESRMNGLNTHETLYLPNRVKRVFI